MTEIRAALPPSSKKSRSSQFLYFVGPLLFFPWWIKTPKGKWKPIHQHSWPDSEPLNGFIDSLFCSTLCVTLAQAVHTRRIKMVLVKRHYFILSLLPLRPVNLEQKQHSFKTSMCKISIHCMPVVLPRANVPWFQRPILVGKEKQTMAITVPIKWISHARIMFCYVLYSKIMVPKALRGKFHIREMTLITNTKHSVYAFWHKYHYKAKIKQLNRIFNALANCPFFFFFKLSILIDLNKHAISKQHIGC